MSFLNKNESKNLPSDSYQGHSSNQLNAWDAIRPAGWAHFLLLPIAGWLFAENPKFSDLIIGLISSVFLLAHAYGFNNYKDNRAQQSVWWHRWPLILFFSIVLLQKLIPQISAGVFLLISAIYSGRCKLKGLPIFGLVLNGGGFALFTLMAVVSPSIQNYWLFLMVALWVAATQLIHEEAHMEQDAQAGYLTTVILLGTKSSRILAVVLLLLATIAALFLNVLLGVALIFYVLLFSCLALRLRAKELRWAMKWLGLLWALIAGIKLLGGTVFNRFN